MLILKHLHDSSFMSANGKCAGVWSTGPSAGSTASASPTPRCSRSSRQRLEERARVTEVGGLEAFGEPRIDRAQYGPGAGAVVLLIEQPRQARRGAQLPSPGALTACDVPGLLEAGAGGGDDSLALFGQQKLASQAMDLRLVISLAGLARVREGFVERVQPLVGPAAGPAHLGQEAREPAERQASAGRPVLLDALAQLRESPVGI